MRFVPDNARSVSTDKGAQTTVVRWLRVATAGHHAIVAEKMLQATCRPEGMDEALCRISDNVDRIIARLEAL